MYLMLVLFLLINQPVINPDNVRPGDWFTPKTQIQTEPAQQEAFRQYVCAVRTNQVYPDGENGAC